MRGIFPMVNRLGSGFLLLAAVAAGMSGSWKASDRSAIVAAAIAAPAAGDVAAAAGPIKIACLVKDASATFWQAAIQGCKDAAEHYHVEVVFGSGNSDAGLTAQVNAFDNALAKGVIGIAMSAVDSSAMSQEVIKANKQNVLVSTFDTTVNDGKLVTNVVPQDREGTMGATKLLANSLGGQTKVAITTCNTTISTCHIVYAAFTDEVQKFPALKVVGRPLATPYRDKAYTSIKSILAANPDLAGVYSTFDLDGLGAYAAGESVNKHLVVVSRGCGYEVLHSILKGGLTGCNAMYPRKEAYTAVEAIVLAHQGKTVQAQIQVPETVVTKANAQKWLTVPEYDGPPQGI
jgi:ribose transport system substrate-binding protein